MNTMTGSFEAISGLQTFSVRQSSSIGPSLEIVYSGCGQAAPNCVASRVPSQRSGGSGGAERRGPSGGFA